jgi:hypothetical protein
VQSNVWSLANCWNWGGPCSLDIGGNGEWYQSDNANRVRIRTFVVDEETGVRTYSAPQNRYYAV